MKLFPYDHFTIETTLKNEDVVSIMEKSISKPKISYTLLNSYDTKYVGTVSNVGFKIKKIPKFTNIARPIITGKFINAPEGIIIDVSMRMNFFLYMFLFIWISGALIGIFSKIFEIGFFNREILFWIIVINAAYAIPTLAFYLEAIPSRRFFNELFGKSHI